jgi:G:T-mismatch repair DNA endonuclease (very short patch repair protein)
MKKLRECPVCFKVLENGSAHIYKCGKSKEINKEEVKFLYIKHNFSEISNEEKLKEEYEVNMFSLPDIRNKYGLDFKSILFLLDYFKIKRRSGSESSILISVPKQKITMKKNYGVEWSSQLESVKELKRQKNIEKFGVDNIWKSNWFKENQDRFFFDKHGMDRSEYNKQYWNSLPEEDKKEHILKSLTKSSIESSIELKIKAILDIMNIQYISQMKIFGKLGNIYLFDICVGNILIEVNGDFWHANPNKYKSGDILRIPGREKTSEEIWKRDQNKRLDAEKKGFNVVYLWECFIRKSSNEELIEVLKDIIFNKNFKDRNYADIKSKSEIN